MTKRKEQVDRCLDEIEAAFRVMNKRKTTEEIKKKCRGWVRKQKKILKELKYKGKMPRMGV